MARCSLLYLSDLEVTGISRSGRVRKKSSKLVDFESDDLTENKLKRQKAQQLQTQLLDQYDVQQQQQILPPQSSQVGNAGQQQRKNSGSSHAQQRLKLEMSDNEGQSSSSESDDPSGINEEERYSMDSGSDNEVDPLIIDEREMGFRKLEPPAGQETPSQANSLYMLEKCKKKLVIKDGKIIGKTKAQRKDKGVRTDEERYHEEKSLNFFYIFRKRDLPLTCYGQRKLGKNC